MAQDMVNGALARRASIGLLSATMIIGTAFGASAATHKPKPKPKPKPVRVTRTVIESYSNPCIAYVVGGSYLGDCPKADAIGNSATELYVTLSAKDATGRRVAIFFQDAGPAVNTTGRAAPSEIVCGAAKDLPIAAHGTVSIDPAAPVGVTSCPTPATKGTITITFSNLP
ncbi:MAG TPA: hypothetical protein VNG13_01520 [Mycobacteriales bacterium]|nr:hypothetical protein [Mycobacteriales bacterium]